jgi:hypothetical protein
MSSKSKMVVYILKIIMLIFQGLRTLELCVQNLCGEKLQNSYSKLTAETLVLHKCLETLTIRVGI